MHKSNAKSASIVETKEANIVQQKQQFCCTFTVGVGLTITDAGVTSEAGTDKDSRLLMRRQSNG